MSGEREVGYSTITIVDAYVGVTKYVLIYGFCAGVVPWWVA